MIPIQVEMSQADRNRIALALRAEEFGLPDPIASAKARGMEFSHSWNYLAINFQNRPMLRCTDNVRQDVTVNENLPPEAHTVLRNLLHKMRDTAKRVDSLMKADKRDIKAVREQIESDQVVFPFAQEDLFMICAHGDQIPGHLKIENWGYDASQYTAKIISPLCKDNDIVFGRAFSYVEGEVRRSHFLPRQDVFQDLVEQARPLQARIVASLDLPAADVATFSQEDLLMWDQAVDINHEVHGLKIAGDTYSVSISKDDVLLMTLTKRGHDPVMVCEMTSGPMSDEIKNSMISIARTAIITPPIKAINVEDQIMAEAADAIASISTGYDL